MPTRSGRTSAISKRSDHEAETTSIDDYWNVIIVIVGVVLAVLCALFLQQAKSLYYHAANTSDGVDHDDSYNPQGSTVESDGRGVARLVHGPNMARRVADFVKRNEPFICRACLASSDKVGGGRRAAPFVFWNNDTAILEAAGPNSTLAIRVATRPTVATKDAKSHEQAEPTIFARSEAPSVSQSGYIQRQMTLSDFVAAYSTSDDGEHLYAAQVDVLKSLPKLLPYVQISGPPAELLEAMGPTPPISHRPLSIYWGMGPLVTPIHYDSMENMVCVVSGGENGSSEHTETISTKRKPAKQFLLYDPLQASQFLYLDRSKYGNGVPPELIPPELLFPDHATHRQHHDHHANPKDSAYPLFQYALPSIVDLYPGDCLYIPVYWYHAVHTTAPTVATTDRASKTNQLLQQQRTISINWWRMPDTTKMQFWETAVCQLSGNHDMLVAKAKC